VSFDSLILSDIGCALTPSSSLLHRDYYYSYTDVNCRTIDSILLLLVQWALHLLLGLRLI